MKRPAQSLGIAVLHKWQKDQQPFVEYEGKTVHELELENVRVLEDAMEDGKSVVGLYIPVDIIEFIKHEDLILVQMSAELFESLANAIAVARVKFGETSRVSTFPDGKA